MRFTIPAIALAIAMTAPPAHAARTIPAWARKYNANCSLCHSPAVPRLNAKGIQFKWAGYRMPDEIGEKADVDNVQDYVAARARLRYLYEKTRDEPTAANAFSLENLSLFVGGAIGTSFGGVLELAREDDGEVEALAVAASVWGTEKTHYGVRAGQGHLLLLGGGVAGFDRTIGITSPTPLGEATTEVPFRFGQDLIGAEAYLVTGRNRLSLQVLNSLGGDEEAPSTKKDLVITNQFMWDDAGAGIAAAAYFGLAEGLDPSQEEEDSKFTRLALTANKYFGDFELLGGYVLSRDRDLPAGSVFPGTTNDGAAWWLSGQYTLRSSSLTVFSRWEEIDPDTDASDNTRNRFVLGGVLPVNVPEFMRLALEYRLDRFPRSGRPRTNGIAAELMITF